MSRWGHREVVSWSRFDFHSISVVFAHDYEFSMEAVGAMPKQTSKKKETNYVHTIRSKVDPAVAANIFRRATQDSHTYLDYELSRAWKTKKREGYSSRFYTRNCEGLVEVIQRATEWIAQNPQAADSEGEYMPSAAAIAQAQGIQ